MSAIQLNFTLRTTPHVKTVHLLGSWDNYVGQLPMSRDPNKSTGGWIGTFRFQPGTLAPGQRYWYYYIMDGYHVTHDPAREYVVEPTTQRKLNTLDIPGGRSSKRDSVSSSTSSRSKRASRRLSVDVAKGRSLSPSEIKSPRPVNPAQTKRIVAEAYDRSALDDLQYRMARAAINESDEDDSSDDDSDISSDVPSLTSSGSRTSNSSSPSSISSCSSGCTCERYGITRSGNRVKLDCGGARCGGAGYGSDSNCSSEGSEAEYRRGMTRRHGVVIRG
jgi:hypothetical protein